jgi:hypothetical protein
MKTSLLCVGILAAVFSMGAAPLRTDFSFQGVLNEDGAPANGIYEFRFGLFDAATPGSHAGNWITNANTSVTNGLFNTVLDFGALVFDGTQYWLDIGVRTNGNGDDFTPLLPRTVLLPVPYALHALKAAGVLSNAVDAAAIQGAAVTSAKIADGQVVKSLNSLTDHVTLAAGANVTLTPTGNTLTIAAQCCGDDDWHLLGNLGTVAGLNFLGTRDDKPLEIKVNSTRAFRFEPTPNGAPNLIGGDPVNLVGPAAIGATIAGGGAGLYNGVSYPNRVDADLGAIGGGGANLIERGASFSAVGGGDRNVIEFVADGSTIGGGATNRIGHHSDFCTISGGTGNRVVSNALFAVVSGGLFNLIGADTEAATIGGGQSNRLEFRSSFATISGGGANFIDRGVDYAAIGGGLANVIESDARYAVIGGGQTNRVEIDAHSATITGGAGNVIESRSFLSAVNGGLDNRIWFSAPYAAIGGGHHNEIFPSGVSATIGGGAENTISTGSPHSTIGGGCWNLIRPGCTNATVAGGQTNQIFGVAFNATIGGGFGNAIGTNATASTISGGQNNYVRDFVDLATIGGGHLHSIGGDYSTISGGDRNRIGSDATASSVGGGQLNNIHTGAVGATISGGENNSIEMESSGATIGGGFNNFISEFASFSTIGGGTGNDIWPSATNATIGGGWLNIIDENGLDSTIGGGLGSSITAPQGTIGGGAGNGVFATQGTVGGGNNNIIHSSAFNGTIGGGLFNFVLGADGTVPGGYNNRAEGECSFAAGCRARALHDGTFVWADTNEFTFPSTTNNEFSARCTGGVRFVTGITRIGEGWAIAAGVRVPPGGNAWQALSDRNAKTNFAPVDTCELVDKLAALPMTTWNYKSQDKSIRHIGPMAQDFHAAFKVGEDDKHITTIDADGVALAAIQGLYQILKESQAQVAALETRNRALEQRLEKLERLISSCHPARGSIFAAEATPKPLSSAPP